MKRIIATIALLCLSQTMALAQSKLFIPYCSSVPCSIEIPGYIDRVGTSLVPWMAQLSFPKGYCLFTYRQISDGPIQISIIAPDGAVYSRQDNSKIGETAMDGWYTIQVTSVPPLTEQLFTIIVGTQKSSYCVSQTPQ